MSRYFRLTIGRKIYAIVALSFLGLVAVTLIRSTR